MRLSDAHLGFEIELDSDPEVMRYITGRALSPEEVEAAHRRRLAAAREVPGLGFWAGFAEEGFVGWWILQPPNGPDQPKVAGEADLGYRLLRRHWRHGYASEGARELIRYGFEEVRLNRIFAQTMAVNAASRATMAAIGLTFTRAFSSAGPYDDPVEGAEQGEVEYAVTRTAWEARSQRASGRRTWAGDQPANGSMTQLDEFRVVLVDAEPKHVDCELPPTGVRSAMSRGQARSARRNAACGARAAGVRAGRRPAFTATHNQWPCQDSNLGATDYESAALPAELQGLSWPRS